MSAKQISDFISDVQELLSLDESISTRLAIEHGWTKQQIAQHREELEERTLLRHSLRAQIAQLRSDDLSEPERLLLAWADPLPPNGRLYWDHVKLARTYFANREHTSIGCEPTCKLCVAKGYT